MVNNKINILSIPAHMVLTDALGSEFTSALDIMKYVVTNYRSVCFSAVCGTIEFQGRIPRLTIYSLLDKRPHIHSLIDKLRFSLRYYNLGKKFLKEKNFHVVHHMFPFGFGVGINLLAILNGLGRKPFIIGPLQYPQRFETISNLKRLKGHVTRTLLKSVKIMHKKTLAMSDVLVFDDKKTLELYKCTKIRGDF